MHISSGHHQVADALIDWCRDIDSTIVCEKVDPLRYSYGIIEPVVSGIYLKWIRYLPGTYSWVYRKSVGECPDKNKRYRLYEMLFGKFVLDLIGQSKPGMIVCTHALPSYIAGRLKQAYRLPVTIVNVYTDFFINDLWGNEGIDAHLVPDNEAKQRLIRLGVDERRISVTGIPVHPKLARPRTEKPASASPLTVLIAGGSLGAGVIQSLVARLNAAGRIRYKVLCGKNRRLYEYVRQLGHPFVTPLPYIQSREEMNAIYDEADAILTKPGGVTLSESLRKGIPTFVYHALPGQEEMNLRHLLERGVVVELKNWQRLADLEGHLVTMLQSSDLLDRLRRNMTEYRQQMPDSDLRLTLEKMLSTM